MAIVYLVRYDPEGTMNRQFIFIETQTFTKWFIRLRTDRDLFVAQEKILSDPWIGNLIPSIHGLQKKRIPLRDHGTQGGARIIYCFDERHTIYLLLAYPKASKTGLTAVELKMLSKLMMQSKGE